MPDHVGAALVQRLQHREPPLDDRAHEQHVDVAVGRGRDARQLGHVADRHVARGNAVAAERLDVGQAVVQTVWRRKSAIRSFVSQGESS